MSMRNRGKVPWEKKRWEIWRGHLRRTAYVPTGGVWRGSSPQSPPQGDSVRKLPRNKTEKKRLNSRKKGIEKTLYK